MREKLAASPPVARRRCMQAAARPPEGNPSTARRTCISGCLRKSLPSLMISTLERLALLEAGGRLGVATQVATPGPALRELVLAAHGWRTRPPPVAKAQLADCMFPVGLPVGAALAVWQQCTKWSGTPDRMVSVNGHSRQGRAHQTICQHGKKGLPKPLLVSIQAEPCIAVHISSQ